MSLKIEVGDKVRIVRVPPGNSPRWGAPGDIATVKHIEHGTSVGLIVQGCGPLAWWHQMGALALFADELEDMPTDTVVTFKQAGWRTRYLGAGEACRRFRGGQ